MLKYEGKVAGITGVGDNKGLGYAITKKLLEQGCKCFIIELNQTSVDAMAKELSQFGEVIGFSGDVSNYDTMKAIIDKVVAKYGSIDFYINNAGICGYTSIEDTSLEAWDRAMAVNVRSVFISGKLVVPHMKPGSSIVNAASFVSLIPTASMPAYSASKAAVLTLTQVMAAEFAKKGIRVNAYVPGAMDTTMNAQRIATIPEKLLSQIPAHRFGTPEDVANAVSFLVSEEASYINGTYINVSGGKFCTQNPDWAYTV